MATQTSASDVAVVNEIEQRRQDEKIQRLKERIDDVLLACEHWVSSNPCFMHGGRTQYGNTKHACNQIHCRMDQLTISVYKNGLVAHQEIAHRCYSVETYDGRVINRCEMPPIHKPAVAFDAGLKLELLFETSEIFVCRQTGRMHWCGDMCDQADNIDSSSGVGTCTVTGRADVRRVELAHKMQCEDVALKERQSLFRKTFYMGKTQALGDIKAWCRELIHHSTFDDIDTFLTRSLASAKYADVKRCYWMTAISQMWKLLCDESQSVFKEAQRSMNQMASTFLDTKFDSHRHRSLQAMRQKVPPALMVLSEIDTQYEQLLRRQCFSECERVPNVTDFMTQHACMTMMVWQNVHMYAPTERISCSLATFGQFAAACLYILRDGLVVQGYSTSIAPCAVYTEHTKLKQILPSYEKLRLIPKLQCIVDTSMRCQIELTIKDAVNNKNVNPRMFAIHGMEYASLQTQYFPSASATRSIHRRQSRQLALSRHNTHGSG